VSGPQTLNSIHIRLAFLMLRAAHAILVCRFFTFSVFPGGHPLVDLNRITIALALRDNAFEAGYRSYEELLSIPNPGTSNFLPLRWKPDILEQAIFQVTSDVLGEGWTSLCIACGIRDIPRLYATRVGAGARLDGKCPVSTPGPAPGRSPFPLTASLYFLFRRA